ncbi:hypothetical protein [Mesorhizobium sp. M1A.F.Ca.ET.072.01.1.1]|uniref:hypothetical protein n=1 Tax=Mesorhizobium sp. M1A.F.Ca.ET.072.01.1.1 TaxID=2496753 RepID=UPI00167C191D|nr:hypothetical protein [Mesorhizobium sp. M1A.F.Ca.ET.072.01.1.1]
MPKPNWKRLLDDEMIEELRHAFNLETRAEVEALIEKIAMDLEQFAADRVGRH